MKKLIVLILLMVSSAHGQTVYNLLGFSTSPTPQYPVSVVGPVYVIMPTSTTTPTGTPTGSATPTSTITPIYAVNVNNLPTAVPQNTQIFPYPTKQIVDIGAWPTQVPTLDVNVRNFPEWPTQYPTQQVQDWVQNWPNNGGVWTPTYTPTATFTGSATPTNTQTPLTGVNVNNGLTIVGPVPAHGVTDIGVETPIWNLSNRATTMDTGHVTISSMPNVSGSVSLLNGSTAVSVLDSAVSTLINTSNTYSLAVSTLVNTGNTYSLAVSTLLNTINGKVTRVDTGSVTVFPSAVPLTVANSSATTLAAGSALIGVCSIYSTSANRSVSATGMAVSCLGAYPMKTLSMAVTSIGGSGAVTMALYAWSNPTYAGGVSVAAITITGASASGQTFISNPFPALQYGVSVLGIAASTTITAFVQGAQF